MLNEETQLFLASLPVFETFSEVVFRERYRRVPGDWSVLICDVRNSTVAVEQGRYRDVCFLSAACVMAVTNRLSPLEPLYVFGGDGATFVVPPEVAESATETCLAMQRHASEIFGFDFRVARIPVRDLDDSGESVLVAKLRLSDKVCQLLIHGGGAALAENWAKKPPLNRDYTARSFAISIPKFDGVECRWTPVESRFGDMATLVVEVTEGAAAESDQILGRLLDSIQTLLRDPKLHRPVDLRRTRLTRGLRSYWRESQIRNFGRGLVSRFLSALNYWFLTQLFDYLWKTVLRGQGERYRRELTEHTDYRKFDGSLKMVLDVSPAEQGELKSVLESFASQGKIRYGLHLSKRALMTCLILDRIGGNHMHLIDGDDGGYTVAAKDLKRKRRTDQKLVIGATG